MKGIWDTAGAEKFESISEQYTRNSDAAIICYDVTDKPTFEKAKQWVKFVVLFFSALFNLKNLLSWTINGQIYSEGLILTLKLIYLHL